MSKRLLCLLLAVIMVLSLFLTSCAGNTSEEEEDSDAEQADEDVLRKYMAITIYGICDDSMTEEGMAAVEEKISNYCVARYKTSIDLRLFRASEYESALNSLYDKFAAQDEEKRIAEEAKASSSLEEKELLRKMTKEEKLAYNRQKRLAEAEAKEAAKKAAEEEAKLVEEGKDKTVAAEEVQLDILFLPTMQDFYDAVDQELVIDLKSYLDNKNKLITDYVYPSFLGATTINGATYGIPTNRGIETKETYLVVNRALAEKYEVDWTKFHSLKDLEEVFRQIRANDPGVTPIYGDFEPEDVSFYHPTEDRDAGNLIAVNASTLLHDPFKVTASEESFVKSCTSRHSDSLKEENVNFLRYVEWKSAWRQAGYMSDTNRNFFLTVEELSTEERQAREAEGYLTVLYKGAPFTTEEALGYGVFAISKRCEYPERAMEIMQLLYTDETLHNLFAFGVEGVNYVVNNDGKTVTLVDDSYKMDLFKTGNALLGYLPGDMDPDYITNAKAKNLNSRLDPFLGFRMDWTDPALSEWLEYFDIWHEVVGDRFDRICYGVADPGALYDEMATVTSDSDRVVRTYSNLKDSTTLFGSYKTHAAMLAQLDAQTQYPFTSADEAP